MMLNTNKKGNIMLALLFAMLVFGVMISVLSLNKTTQTNARQVITTGSEYYGYDTICNLVTDEIMVQMNRFSAEMNRPVENMDDYEVLVQNLDANISNADGSIAMADVKKIIQAHITDEKTCSALIELLGTQNNYSIVCKKTNNLKVDELGSDEIAFHDGDKVSLTPLEVQLNFTCRGATILKTIRISGLYIDVSISNKTTCYIDYTSSSVSVISYSCS